MMTTRERPVFALMLGAVLTWGCASQAPAGATPAAGVPQPAAHPEQALIDDLVLAYRMFAKELKVLDTAAHVSVRSQRDPSHFYMSRYLAPGAATASDIIEHDRDSRVVAGRPADQAARETHLHGQIYQARPDVMAIVHAHTPEFIAYGMSSVPLWDGASRVPVWDIRPYNEGRSGTVQTPALGRAMAAGLGDSHAVLLWGHGVAVTAASLPELVARTADLRDSARLQMGVIAMGGTWTPETRPTEPAVIQQTWAHLKQRVTDEAGGHIPTTQPPAPPPAANPIEAAKRNLVLANRIMATEEVRVLSSFGHVSVRSPTDPNRYFVVPGIAADLVTAGDIVERNLTDSASPVPGLSIHEEVYKARPDVMAVVYAETPEVVMLSKSPFRLRPIGIPYWDERDGFVVFDLGRLDRGQSMLTNPALGRGIAEALKDNKSIGVLLPGQGFVVTGRSLAAVTNQAYSLRMSALIQQQAIALRGKVAYLDDPPPPLAPNANPGTPPWPAGAFPDGQPAGEGRDWVYWRQMYAPAR